MGSDRSFCGFESPRDKGLEKQRCLFNWIAFEAQKCKVVNANAFKCNPLVWWLYSQRKSAVQCSNSIIGPLDSTGETKQNQCPSPDLCPQHRGPGYTLLAPLDSPRHSLISLTLDSQNTHTLTGWNKDSRVSSKPQRSVTSPLTPAYTWPITVQSVERSF